MDFNDLTPEQQEMARACKGPEELAELAESFGMQISDEDLASVAGGLTRGEDSPCACNAESIERPAKNAFPPCPIAACKWRQ